MHGVGTRVQFLVMIFVCTLNSVKHIKNSAISLSIVMWHACLSACNQASVLLRSFTHLKYGIVNVFHASFNSPLSHDLPPRPVGH